MRIVWPEKSRFVFLLLAPAVFGHVTAASARQSSLPLHLEVGPLSMLRMPSWVALSEGIYKKNGLDVDQCHTPITVEELKALGVATSRPEHLSAA